MAKQKKVPGDGDDGASKRGRRTFGPRTIRCKTCYSCVKMQKYKCVGPEGSERDQILRLKMHILGRDLPENAETIMVDTHEEDKEPVSSSSGSGSDNAPHDFVENIVKHAVLATKFEDISAFYTMRQTALQELLALVNQGIQEETYMAQALSELGHPDADSFAKACGFAVQSRSELDKAMVAHARKVLTTGKTIITEELTYLESAKSNSDRRSSQLEDGYIEATGKYWELEAAHFGCAHPRAARSLLAGAAKPFPKATAPEHKPGNDETEVDLDMLDSLLSQDDECKSKPESRLALMPSDDGTPAPAPKTTTSSAKLYIQLHTCMNKLTAHMSVVGESDDKEMHELADEMLARSHQIQRAIDGLKSCPPAIEMAQAALSAALTDWFCTS